MPQPAQPVGQMAGEVDRQQRRHSRDHQHGADSLFICAKTVEQPRQHERQAIGPALQHDCDQKQREHQEPRHEKPPHAVWWRKGVLGVWPVL